MAKGIRHRISKQHRKWPHGRTQTTITVSPITKLRMTYAQGVNWSAEISDFIETRLAQYDKRYQGDTDGHT